MCSADVAIVGPSENVTVFALAFEAGSASVMFWNIAFIGAPGGVEAEVLNAL